MYARARGNPRAYSYALTIAWRWSWQSRLPNQQARTPYLRALHDLAIEEELLAADRELGVLLQSFDRAKRDAW